MQSFMLNEKKLNLGPKLPYLGIFGLEIEKKLLPYLKSAHLSLSKLNF